MCACSLYVNEFPPSLKEGGWLCACVRACVECSGNGDGNL